MKIAFWILVIIISICLWFALAVLFQPMGRWITKIFKDTTDIINDKETEDKQ